MSILIIKPHTGEIAYEKAAEAFQDMYQKVTGISLPVATEDDGVSDLVLIGSDAVNDIALELFFSKGTKAVMPDLIKYADAI